MNYKFYTFLLIKDRHQGFLFFRVTDSRIGLQTATKAGDRYEIRD